MTRKPGSQPTRSGQRKRRLSVYVPDEVFKALRHRAVDEDKDLSQLAEEALRQFLRLPPGPVSR